MPDTRNENAGPARTPAFAHRFEGQHARVVSNDRPDLSFHNNISNKAKVAYICEVLRLEPGQFRLDLPFPVEDWALSDDRAILNCGLYLNDLRLQFYGGLIHEDRARERSELWARHAEAEYWAPTFNGLVTRRGAGVLQPDTRVRH